MLLARQGVVAARAAATRAAATMLPWGSSGCCWPAARRGLLASSLSSPSAPRSPLLRLPASASSDSAPPTTTTTSTTVVHQAPQQQARRTFTTRDYPPEPRVGIGVVVFRRRRSPRPEILLIRRAKAPCKGEWCFPGGSLELGETVAQCAAREVEEETGVRLSGASTAAALTNLSDLGSSDPDLGVGRDADGDARLDWPVPFAVVDSIVYDDDGDKQQPSPTKRTPQFHFCIVEVAAVLEPEDQGKELAPSDDADAAGWFALEELRSLKGLTRGCAALAEQAARRFRVYE